MFNILIAEDDNNLRNLMDIKLREEGYNTILSKNGIEAYEKVFENHVDLMVVDVMMPGMNGFELVSTLRKNNLDIPTIICTAKGEIEDKVEGFSIGIDDYVVKPVDFSELLLRIKAILRRVKAENKMVLNIGDVVLEYNSLSVKYKDLEVILTKTEFLILFKLFSNIGQPYSKNELYEEFWDFDSDTEEDVVKVFINKIRNKILVIPTIGIETVRGVGYKGVVYEK